MDLAEIDKGASQREPDRLQPNRVGRVISEHSRPVPVRSIGLFPFGHSVIEIGRAPPWSRVLTPSETMIRSPHNRRWQGVRHAKTRHRGGCCRTLVRCRGDRVLHPGAWRAHLPDQYVPTPCSATREGRRSGLGRPTRIRAMDLRPFRTRTTSGYAPHRHHRPRHDHLRQHRPCPR
jgi:hypothetical protein